MNGLSLWFAEAPGSEPEPRLRSSPAAESSERATSPRPGVHRWRTDKREPKVCRSRRVAAQSSGDPVLVENYLQHADHYSRKLAELNGKTQNTDNKNQFADDSSKKTINTNNLEDNS